MHDTADFLTGGFSVISSKPLVLKLVPLSWSTPLYMAVYTVSINGKQTGLTDKLNLAHNFGGISPNYISEGSVSHINCGIGPKF